MREVANDVPTHAIDDVDQTVIHHEADDAGCDTFDRLAEEFADRCRRGEMPSIDEYVARYPEQAQRIRDLFPSIGMMEQLKRRVDVVRDDSTSLHEPGLQSLGEYRIIRELGRGGMGIVYEAFQESLQRHVALKVIPRQGLLDARRRQRFQREAMAVAQLHHTNIVPIFAVGEHDGLPYYAMQYIRGDGLDRLLQRWRSEGLERGARHWRFVALIGMQAAQALQYAHDQGVLHRDIKPANILVDEHEVAWLTDFGLAKLMGRDDLTNSGDVVGTLRYLAPEALRGEADHRGDIYSLGLTLYELLTLQLPFGERSPSELLRCVTEEQPIRPRKVDSSIPRDLETIILKATAREPGHRYATAGALADDLRWFIEGRPILARRTSPPERLVRWCRRNKGLAAALGVAAVGFLFALIATLVGYVTTSRALDRTMADERAAQQVIGQFFDILVDADDHGPFSRHWGPPTGGGSPPGWGDRKTSDRGSMPPDRGPGPPSHGPPPDGDGSAPDSDSTQVRGKSPQSDEERRRPGGMMPVQVVTAINQREAALLETVLGFYGKFAERNATNSRLQGEDARAYRKVATLYRKLGRLEEAEQAHEKSLRRFEALAAAHPDDAGYQLELARTVALDDQRDLDDSQPDRSAAALRQGIGIVERLLEKTPSQPVHAAALARWNARLGHILGEKLRRTDEAISCYRASIEHDDWLAEHVPDPSMVRWVISSNRMKLADLLIDQGRKDEARAVLDRAADDLQALDDDGRPPRDNGRELVRRFRELAQDYREVGNGFRAEALMDRATRIQNRGVRHGGPHGRPHAGIDPFPNSGRETPRGGDNPRGGPDQRPPGDESGGGIAPD
ncbi:MAG: protein kinase domain-containing protein [Isosphaeraceae bacterium]